MILLRTAEEMARALDSPLEPELKQLLAAHRERLSECDDYELSELAQFAIAEPGDTLQDVSSIIGIKPGEGGAAPQFATIPEYVEQHGSWVELVFVLSDFGEGGVLFIPAVHDTDPLILALAKRYLDEFAAS